MAGTVFLKTNRLEVKLEGITFKTSDFESLCKMDFLFPDGKIWIRPPTVGIDVMRHPRDPSIVLVLLCFGVGCVIIRFCSGETIPKSIFKFLSDERIRFVGFGIPEKEDLFPFKQLGLSKSKVDIGYIAAKVLNDPKYKSCDLSVLAHKILRIKSMVRLTDASYFERHEQIKCAICHLFVTSTIAMTLLGLQDKKKLHAEPVTCSFINTLNSLPVLNEGWFKIAKAKKDDKKVPQVVECKYNLEFRPKCKKAVLGVDFDYAKSNEDDSSNDYVRVRCKEDDSDDDLFRLNSKVDDLGSYKGHKDGIKLERVDSTKKPFKESLKCPSSDYEGLNSSPPLKGILKCPSSRSVRFSSSPPLKGILKCPSSNSKSLSRQSPPVKGVLEYPTSGSENCSPSPPKSSLSVTKGKNITRDPSLKRANSKGFNVTFK